MMVWFGPYDFIRITIESLLPLSDSEITSAWFRSVIVEINGWGSMGAMDKYDLLFAGCVYLQTD